MVATLNRLHVAARILGEGGAKTRVRRRPIDSRSLVAHRDEHRHSSIRPPLHSNPILEDVVATAQIAQSSIGVERPHGLLTHRGWAILVAALGETLRIAARAEAID